MGFMKYEISLFCSKWYLVFLETSYPNPIVYSIIKQNVIESHAGWRPGVYEKEKGGDFIAGGGEEVVM